MYENCYRNLPDVLTRKEAQSILRVGKNTIFKLIHSGELPAVQLGNKRIKIKKIDLINYIENSIYIE